MISYAAVVSYLVGVLLSLRGSRVLAFVLSSLSSGVWFSSASYAALLVEGVIKCGEEIPSLVYFRLEGAVCEVC